MQHAVTTYPGKQPTAQPTTLPGKLSLPNSATAPTFQQWQQMRQIPIGWTLKEKLIVGLIGVAVVGGSAYLIQKQVRKVRANREENETFEDGGASTYAKQIKMAFENDGWPGTDTVALRNVLRQIPSKEVFNTVAKKYETLYSDATSKANLYRDLKEELQSTEYNEMLQLINGKPEKKGGPLPTIAYQAWAKRLKSAFDKSYGPFGGTDGEAIVACFTEIPTQAAFIRVGVAYQQMYGTPLMSDLKSEGEFGQYEEWMRIIVTKRKQ